MNDTCEIMFLLLN